MLSDEITIYGFIKIPYPFLKDFNKKIDELKGKTEYKNFPDFIMQHTECMNNAISAFAYSYRYEVGFEKLLSQQFEYLLSEIKFLLATLVINIEDKKYMYYEYVSDGSNIHKTLSDVKEVESSFLATF